MNICPLIRSTGNIPITDEWDITFMVLYVSDV